ncbi:unnamed protein product [Rotaria sp. Silwood2]|nr:unnamed protein product [Rotaria sp. Silwood2]
MIRDNAHCGSYACFDADQTSYQWDLEESTFAYLEMKNILTREKLDPALILVPFIDTEEHKENLFSYYNRLRTDIDAGVGINWMAQAFSGMTLKELKIYVDEMLQSNTGNTKIKTILTKLSNNSIIQTEYDAPIPNFYRAQQELYNRLMANGIEVYVLTASNEELVRMVLSDPKYGYNVKPENVIGLATFLKDGTAITASRKQITDNTYNQQQNLNLKLTSYIWSPQVMFVGKYGAILTYISQWKMPILVAGDTPASDGYVLFHAYNQQRDTLRLWVNRNDAYLTLIQQMQNQHAQEQHENGLRVTANKNWIYVKPNDLGPITLMGSMTQVLESEFFDYN